MSTAATAWRAPRFESFLGVAARKSPRTIVVVAFLLAVTAFVGSTLVAAARLGRVSAGSQAISTNVMPALIALTTLRERLGELQRGANTAVDAGASGLPDLDRHVAEIQAQSIAYEQHATLPRQRESWAHVHDSVLLAVDQAKLIRSDLAARDTTKAREDLDTELRPTSSVADQAIASLITNNATAAEEVARDIDHVRRRATALLLVLDLACVCFAVALASIAVRAARAMEARSNELLSFAGRVAHDIRGPLSPVLMGLKLLSDELPEEDPGQMIIGRATRSVGRIMAIVDDLLAFARAGGHADRKARAGVVAAAHATIEEVSPLAATNDITLRIEGPEEEVFASCPDGVLASLLGNLVNNAIKYMGKAELRVITVRVSPLRNRVLVEVEDTGPGLPPGAEKEVFHPYVRADRSGQPGLGLGLATVKRLAEAYGGRVNVISGPEGSTFSFELPLA
jgi:signal transduction histidine kinase